ncbi:MAG: hypothetical protein KGM17_07965 [Sphingomonadales bacterium]|nr:hypothetical protein [Sphingomonadales bacterium]
MTPFDDGAVVLSSFNPDDGSRQDVVLMKEQWRKVIELAIAAYGRQHCAYNSGPGRCSAGRNALCTEPC